MMTESYFSIISSLIKEESKVLDIGCGDGELIEYLMETRNIRGKGIELSMSSVRKAVSKGLSVIQGDANHDLDYYNDKSVDYAVLSNTLQAMRDVEGVLNNLVRIGKKAIIVIPNFAHYSARAYLLFHGQMPVTKNMPYEWYDTPNIHFCALKDFERLCHKLGIKIKKKVFLDRKGKTIKYNPFVNLFTLNAVFVIKK